MDCVLTASFMHVQAGKIRQQQAGLLESRYTTWMSVCFSIVFKFVFLVWTLNFEFDFAYLIQVRFKGFLVLYPIHVVIKIQKRRGVPDFSFEYNLLPKLISNFYALYRAVLVSGWYIFFLIFLGHLDHYFKYSRLVLLIQID